MLKRISQVSAPPVILFIITLWLVSSSSRSSAHCDALDGPVVTEAREALSTGDVTPLLKWVHEEDDELVKVAFADASAVRELGPKAMELADRYFFETLVRLHRASEGAPYTGLKPPGLSADPIVKSVDESLTSGNADELVSRISTKVEHGLRERHAAAKSARTESESSVEAGRDYVAAYVELVHYAKALHSTASGDVAHHEHEHAAETHAAVHTEHDG